MSSSASQFVISRRMDFYEPNLNFNRWREGINGDYNQPMGTSIIIEGNIDTRSENVSQETLSPSKTSSEEAKRPKDKVLRRLAQNREAARKSRLRKKAYVQQLESSRIKLSQLEQELATVKQQGIFVGAGSGATGLGISASVNADIAAFDVEYAHWIEEQNKHICELRGALQQHVSDVELQMLVERGMEHYSNLFRIKAVVAKSDIFYIMSGMWKSAAERCFLWIGGFRPSELLKILLPELEPLAEQQLVAVCTLQLSSQQAEDALSQGMDRLQQTLSETVASNPLTSTGVENYVGQMAIAIGKLEALESFVNQADHLRLQTMRQMYRILTTRQAARGLLVLGDYIQRLRALSSLWSARPCEPT